MAKQIFVNLPVADLGRAVAFYEALGARKEPKFSDDTAACMVLSDTIYVMLLTHAKFAGFTPRPLADARAATEVLVALSTDSRAEVDAIVDRAAAAGGVADLKPAQDYGFMYYRNVEDPDGHIWEVLWMDPATAEAGVHDAAAAQA